MFWVELVKSICSGNDLVGISEQCCYRQLKHPVSKLIKKTWVIVSLIVNHFIRASRIKCATFWKLTNRILLTSKLVEIRTKTWTVLSVLKLSD